jgi:LptD protein
VGNEKWFEKVAFQYSSQLQNQVQTKDSLFFTKKMWDNAQFGVKHDASTNISFNILKYFNFSPSVNYSEVWYLKQQNLTYNPKVVSIKSDTIKNPTDTTDFTIRRDTTFSVLDTTIKKGFYRLPQFSMGASLSTRIFGTVQFKNGWLRGLRHTINPSIGFSYSPNYIRYYDSVRTNVNSTFREIYSKYANAIYGTPSSGGKQASINYSFTNLFEAKTFSRKDSTFKKTKLLEAVNINGSYNMLADSFKFSQISMSTGTNFFNGRTTLGVNALFDPYGQNLDGTRSKELAFKKNKRFLNFQNMLISVNTGISIGEIQKILRGGDENSNSTNSNTNLNSTDNTPRNTRKADIPNESMLDLISDFRLNHQFSVSRNRIRGRDTTVFQNALYTSGNIPLTKKWRLTVGNIGYDFVQKQMTYPDFGIYRDLHCWEMGVNWQPIRGTYSFYLRVKPGTFDFLKIPYNKNVGDAFGTRR